MKAFEVACSIPWAIREESLSLLLDIARRENDPEWEALASRMGKPVEFTHQATVRDSIATVPVDGPMFAKANMLTRYSGATSYSELATDLGAALADPTIRGVMLSINSPGGTVEGVSELAALIRSAKGRKPIHAHAWGSCASAAYWLASAAEKVSIAPTGLMGSIGVISTIRNKKNPDELQFVSSVSPDKRPNLTTDEGRATVQAEVDRLGEVFVRAVAEQRATTPERVLADFGRGSCKVGEDAVQAGMADGVSTYEETHARLAEQVSRPRVSFSFPAPAVPVQAPALKFGV